MIIIRADLGAVDILADRDGIAALIGAISSMLGGELILDRASRENLRGFEGCFGILRIRQGQGKVAIARRGQAVEFSGTPAALNALADALATLLQTRAATASFHRIHTEFYPGQSLLAAESEGLTVNYLAPAPSQAAPWEYADNQHGEA